MTVNIDELRPVDWIVVEFPGTKLTGEIAPCPITSTEPGARLLKRSAAAWSSPTA